MWVSADAGLDHEAQKMIAELGACTMEDLLLLSTEVSSHGFKLGDGGYDDLAERVWGVIPRTGQSVKIVNEGCGVS